jgi:mRNA-degrading endonuclease RelE of RelBE toxin-antitoxin system
MSYSIKATPLFEKEFKRLCKKFPSAKEDVRKVITSLRDEPLQGTSIGKDCYKLRIAIKSKGKGKSGGSRLITRVRITKTTVYLLSIYDKSEKDSLSDRDIDNLLNSL